MASRSAHLHRESPRRVCKTDGSNAFLVLCSMEGGLPVAVQSLRVTFCAALRGAECNVVCVAARVIILSETGLRKEARLYISELFAYACTASGRQGMSWRGI